MQVKAIHQQTYTRLSSSFFTEIIFHWNTDWPKKWQDNNNIDRFKHVSINPVIWLKPLAVYFLNLVRMHMM